MVVLANFLFFFLWVVFFPLQLCSIHYEFENSHSLDRRRVGEGKGGDSGGRRSIKKKKAQLTPLVK